MIVTFNTGKELYVYMNGKLLYKRWLTHQYGMVFCDVWGHRPFTCKDSELVKATKKAPSSFQKES